MSQENKIKTQEDFYKEVSLQVQNEMDLKANAAFEYEEPLPKVENKFNHSVASLGDVYNLRQGDDDHLELMDGTVLIPSIETKGIKPHTGRPLSSQALRKKGEINDVFLDPSAIQQGANAALPRQTRVKDVNYLHMAKLEDSKKYNHIANGVINPPQSNFSVKNLIISNIKAHESDMKKVIVYPNRVRIRNVQPEKRSLKPKASQANDQSNSHLVVIGKSVNMNKVNDTHVQFTKPKVVHYKPRALSSKSARKTLLVSEKFVGAVENYFNSSQMKIPSKNSIDQIVDYAQDVEKYLRDYATEMNFQKKPAKYEDPFRKGLKNKRKPQNPPPKIYPVIEDDYQKKVEEQLSRLQGELRQIFDSLTQQSRVKEGDEIKVNSLMTKAKELTRLINHLAGDVNKSKEIALKKIKDTREKENKENAAQSKAITTLLSKNRSSSQRSIQGSTTAMSKSNRQDKLKSTSSSIDIKDTLIASSPNKIMISAINPVQESLIETSILKDSNALGSSTKQQLNQTQPLLKRTYKQSHVSFGNDTIAEEKSNQIQGGELPMSLPNVNLISQEEGNKTLQASQSQPNSLYYVSSNFKPNPLYNSLIDPNITLNNFQMQATKIKVDTQQAIRDDRFSSFNIELPVQYYFQVSKDHEPNKEREWYIRPHHTETFSQSASAIPDDVLNTKYISYIGEAEKKESKSRLQMLEELLAEARSHIDQLQSDMFSQCQTDTTKERLYARLEAIKEEAKKDYVPGHIIDKEKKHGSISSMLTSGEPMSFGEMFEGNEDVKKTNFAIDTYSKLLLEMRTKEQELLNKKRQEEYERIRPPMKNWYELKGIEFQTELKRNKMVINANPEYFEKIKQLTNKELY